MLDKLRAIRAKWCDPQRKRLPLWACLIVVVVIALLLEVFAFNFRHWESLGYQEVVLRDDPIKVTDEDYSLGFSSLDMDVHNVKVDVKSSSDDSNVWMSYAITDEGNSSPYYLPVAEANADNPRSEVQSIFTYGKLKSLRVSFPGDVWGGVNGEVLVSSNSFPVTINSVSVNAQVPFAFSFLRFSLAFLVLSFLVFLRPGAALSRIRALAPQWGPRLVRGGVLAVVLVLLTAYWVSFPKWVAIATPTYNASEYESYLHKPFVVFDQPDTATNEYAKLAQAFSNGQLSLLQTPPDWLNEMEDPYDSGARDEESSKHLRGYLWDTAYFEGNYYVYFGVLPVLVFYLPFYLMTGGTFPNSVAVLIPSLLFVVGVYSLLRALIRYRFQKASLSTFILVFLGILCASGLLFGLGRPGLYNVPVAFARCLAVWGLCLWYRGWCKKSPVRLGGGSLCIALIAASRPQLLILAPLVFVILYLTLRSDMPRKRKISWCAWLFVPIIVVAAGVMWYNWARFGSVTDFGAAYNLTYNNMTMRGHSILRALEGAYYYLFNPPLMVSTFPYLRQAGIYPGFPGTTIYEPLVGGLLMLMPMLLATFFMGGVRRKDKSLFWMISYLAAAGVILVLFDTEGAGVLLRYMQDFGFLLALAAALVFLHHMGGAGSRKPDEVADPAMLVAGYDATLTTGVAPLADSSLTDGVPSVAAASQADDTPLTGADNDSVAASDDSAPVGSHYAVALQELGEDDDDNQRAPQIEDPSVEKGTLDKPRRSAWSVALFVTVALGLFMSIAIFLFMHDPTGDLSVGGSAPSMWEQLRQTFMWWL